MSPLEDIPNLVADRGRTLTVDEQYERKLVWTLCNYLQQGGFMLVQIDDQKEVLTRASTGKKVMEFIFGRTGKEFRLVVGREGFGYHWIDLCVGQGSEIVVDHHYTVGDADGFDKAMTMFINAAREGEGE